MAKEIIFYNLRDDVSDEEYQKWCHEFKGPALVSLESVNSVVMINMISGLKGNGEQSIPPEETALPFTYFGIIDSTNLEEWRKDANSQEFKKKFLNQWFSKWVADFYLLSGMEFFNEENVKQVKNTIKLKERAL